MSLGKVDVLKKNCLRFSFLDDKAVRAKEKNEEPTRLLHYITLCLNKDPQYIQNYSKYVFIMRIAVVSFIPTENNDGLPLLI